MRNLLRDLFDKNYYSDMLKQQKKEWKENRDCFACKRCLDQSDKYNTYHEYDASKTHHTYNLIYSMTYKYFFDCKCLLTSLKTKIS